MGRQHVRDGLLSVTQAKTGITLTIPLHPELRAVLEATPAENMTFLVTREGKPFHPDAFSHWFKRKCREARPPLPGRPPMDLGRPPAGVWRSWDAAPA